MDRGVQQVLVGERRRKRGAPSQRPRRVEAADRGSDLLHAILARPGLGGLLVEPGMEESDLQRRLGAGQRRHQVPDVRAHPAGRRRENLVDQERQVGHNRQPPFTSRTIRRASTANRSGTMTSNVVRPRPTAASSVCAIAWAATIGEA